MTAPAESGTRTADLIVGLARRLRLAEAPLRRLDGRFAPRFNPATLVARETGWARVVAEFLNPDGTHGQGRLFLDALLDELGPGTVRPSAPVRVASEHPADAGGPDAGRLDILVEGGGTPRTALAIEMKIGALDQPRQLERYHAWLARRYGRGHFTLVYLAPDGRAPGRDSLGDLAADDVRPLALAGGVADAPSLTRALRAGCAGCRAERVRWFVELAAEALEGLAGAAEAGEDWRAMTVVGYLREDPERVRTAIEVARAVETLRRDLTAALATVVARRVEARLAQSGEGWGLHARSLIDAPFGEKWTGVSFRKKGREDNLEIRLECNRVGGAYSFYYGAFSDERDGVHGRLDELGGRLRAVLGHARSSGQWAWYRPLGGGMDAWASDDRLPALAGMAIDAEAGRVVPAVEGVVDDLVRLATICNAWLADDPGATPDDGSP